jgi:Uma2 family endonuclease
MATRSDKEHLPQEHDTGAGHDPYEYGWCYVFHPRPDGGQDWEAVRLTLEDVLHPEEGDFRVYSDDHEHFCAYLLNVLEAHLSDDSSAVVFHDVRISWDVPEVKPLTPDISVIFGVQRRINWSTFDVPEEGTRPALIIEITSPGTRHLDLENKVRLYALAGIAYYVIVDDQRRRGQNIRRLLGYHLTPDGYEPLTPNEQGWLWLGPVGLWPGLHDNRVMCYEEEGRPLADYTGMSRARAEVEARALAEAEARLRAMQAELRHLRGNGQES